MKTLNDVIEYSKYYDGTEKPPRFFCEKFNVKDKLFVPVDDFPLGQKLCQNPEEDMVLHYFARDSVQNKLLGDNFGHTNLHKKVYACTSPDFSVDSINCYSCLNQSNILKARICAHLWQTQKDERVILTWIWGKEDTYNMAFGNIEKGSIAAVSSQAVRNIEIFEKGIRYGIEVVQPEYICWYGPVYDFMDKYYDKDRIVPMQKRSELMKQLENVKISSCYLQGLAW